MQDAETVGPLEPATIATCPTCGEPVTIDDDGRAACACGRQSVAFSIRAGEEERRHLAPLGPTFGQHGKKDPPRPERVPGRKPGRPVSGPVLPKPEAQDPKEFALWLRGHRIALGITQQSLANVAGLHTMTVSKLERGAADTDLSTQVLLRLVMEQLERGR